MPLDLTKRGYDTTQAAQPGTFSKLAPGGYVCNIVRTELVKSKSGRDMLNVFIDIAEGARAGYFRKDLEHRRKFKPDCQWSPNGTYYQLLFDTDGYVTPFFKWFVESVEKSNRGFQINPTEFYGNEFTGRLCGFTFGEEEYLKRNGDVGTNIKPKIPLPVDDIKAGNFQIPELTKLKADAPKPSSMANAFSGEPIDDGDTPF